MIRSDEGEPLIIKFANSASQENRKYGLNLAKAALTRRVPTCSALFILL